MHYRLITLLAFLLVGCATTPDRESGLSLEYGCSDLVVVGRIATLSATEFVTDDANDLPGWLSGFSLQIHIKRILHGSEHRVIVPAIRIAHAPFRDDLDLLVALRPIEGNRYYVREATLTSDRPQLSEPCLRD